MVIQGSRKFCSNSRTHCTPRSSLTAAWTLSMRMHVFSAAEQSVHTVSPQNAANRPFLRSRFFLFFLCSQQLPFLAMTVNAPSGPNFSVL